VWDGYPGEFDLDRAFTDFDLSVKATSDLTVTARYRRWTTSGDQLTSFNYSGRGQFPTTVDQRGNAFGVGLQWRIGSTTLFLNQDFRSFESDYVLRDGDNDALAALAQSENRDMSAPVSSVGFRTRLADNKVQVEGDFLYSKQSLDSNYSRNWETGSGGTDSTASAGEAERKLVHGNARVFWRPGDQLAFSARYRRRGWEQRGFRNLVDDGRASLGGLDYDITLDQFLLGAEFAPVRALSVFAEYGTGTREQVFTDLDGDGDPIDDTGFTAYKFGTRIRAGRIFDVEASYARNDIDSPFARVSASDIEGYKVKARLRPSWRWVVSGTYSRSESESDPLLALDGSTNLATSKFQNIGLNVAYMGGAGRSIYAGYAYLDNEINTPIIIWNPVPRFELDTAALYDGQNAVFTFGGEYLLSETFPLTVYGNANYVDSDTTEVRAPELIWTPVDFPVVYYDIRAGARYVLPMGLMLDVQGRWMQYEDTSELFSTNTYDASMFTVGVGYRF